MGFGPCLCGTMPIYADVGGNNKEIEVYCPNCGRSVLAANITAAEQAWEKLRLATGEQIEGLF